MKEESILKLMTMTFIAGVFFGSLIFVMGGGSADLYNEMKKCQKELDKKDSK